MTTISCGSRVGDDYCSSRSCDSRVGNDWCSSSSCNSRVGNDYCSRRSCDSRVGNECCSGRSCDVMVCDFAGFVAYWDEGLSHPKWLVGGLAGLSGWVVCWTG